MPAPSRPQIFHIVHVDRLASIIADGCLWSDAVMAGHGKPGTVIGMNNIKTRRLHSLQLSSHLGLYVGQCVPFYFCPRSVMLYVIYRGNDEGLSYQGGQDPIIHLEGDLIDATTWASEAGRRWAFTLSTAAASYFEDRAELSCLDEIDWDAVRASKWSGPGVSTQVKEGKQAEFLVEQSFPWPLVRRIGVRSQAVAHQVYAAMQRAGHRPPVEIHPNWYY